MRRRRAARGALLVATAFLTAAFLVAGSSVAAIPTASANAAPATVRSISLRGQPAWSALGDDLTFRLAIRTDRPGLEVRATVHGAVLSRFAFERTLDGDRLGSVQDSRSTPVEAMAVVGADRVLTLGLQDPAAPRDVNRVRLTIPGSANAGVFPVEIELRDPESGVVIDAFVTDIVAVRRRDPSEVPNEPLRVAWLWHIAAAPATTPGGAVAGTFASAVEPAGRLGRIATGLGQAGGVPVTLVPNPETVDALRAAADENPRAAAVLGALRTASRSSRVLSSPYTTVDGPSLTRAGLSAPLASALTLGRRTLESGLVAAVDGTTAATQPLDAATLAVLRTDGGATRLAVKPDALADATAADQYTPARPFRLDSPTGSFDAVEINTLTTELLTRPGVGALRAQQLLAGLAVIALEQPNRTRGVVIDTPLLWTPDPTRVAAVLAGLRDHPLIQGAPLVDLFDIPAATTNRGPYTRTLAPVDPPVAPITPDAFADGRRRIDALAAMIGTNDPLVVRLRHELDLTLAGRVPATGPGVSATRLRVISDEVGAVAAGISAPAGRTVTLTSRKASVPLSIANTTGRTVTVEVTLESQKLEFPDGATRRIELGPGNTTTAFDVLARASGTFPVLVTLRSPDNGLDLQRSRYTVRSSAVSGVGLVLTISAGVFLAAWWLTHWRRSRKPRTPTPTPAPAS